MPGERMEARIMFCFVIPTGQTEVLQMCINLEAEAEVLRMSLNP